MVTAITHHRFNSPIWGSQQVGKLYAELAEMEVDMIRALSSVLPGRHRRPAVGQPGPAPS